LRVEPFEVDVDHVHVLLSCERVSHSGDVL
jgi:hypothetical protein